MEETQSVTDAQGADVQSAEYWQNEYDYFMDAIEGIRMSYVVMQNLAEHAKRKLDEIQNEN